MVILMWNPAISSYTMNESTPKSPYAKNAFHFVTFMDDFAVKTVAIIDILLDIGADFWQNERTI